MSTPSGKMILLLVISYQLFQYFYGIGGKRAGGSPDGKGLPESSQVRYRPFKKESGSCPSLVPRSLANDQDAH